MTRVKNNMIKYKNAMMGKVDTLDYCFFLSSHTTVSYKVSTIKKRKSLLTTAQAYKWLHKYFLHQNDCSMFRRALHKKYCKNFIGNFCLTVYSARCDKRRNFVT